MNYLQQIQDLESEAFRKPLCQITIDLIQRVSMRFSRGDDYPPIERDEVGSYVYEIHILLVVFNPSFTYDIEVLNRLCAILVAWRDDIEFVNRTLGIPLHLG